MNIPAEILSKLSSGEISKLELAHNFLISNARFVKSGFATTPPDILAAREATCRACDQWDAAALNATGRCRKCGCSTWAKLRMATESCPLGKWKSVLTTEDTESTETKQRQA